MHKKKKKDLHSTFWQWSNHSLLLLFTFHSPPTTWTALWHPCTGKATLSLALAHPGEISLLPAVLPAQPTSLPVQGRWSPQEGGSSTEAEAPRRAASSSTCVKRSQRIQCPMYVSQCYSGTLCLDLLTISIHPHLFLLREDIYIQCRGVNHYTILYRFFGQRYNIYWYHKVCHDTILIQFRGLRSMWDKIIWPFNSVSYINMMYCYKWCINWPWK